MKMIKLKLLSVLFVSSIFLSACSNPFDQLADEINGFLGSDSSEESTEVEETTDTSDDGNTDTTTDSVEEEIETVDYSHLLNQGEETVLNEGIHEVGSDITPGRYRITTEEGYGNIFVKDEEDHSVAGETLAGEAEARDELSAEFLVFLEDGYSVEITSLETVNFTPYETSVVDEIYPGLWVVGEDFPAGVYDISLEENDSYGSLEVFTQPDMIKSRHSLGSEEYGGMTEFTMSFVDGDIVQLRYIPKVSLTER